ncbi:MAG: hypothetical protein QG671_3469 [Actinomycetota bacterium]|nr:hypothetical protein [Actinomycetota bacterium]HPY25849.1 hypothetical protein [Mycobacterium sp.]
MQITMRSYLTAGTVAVVGAGAIAMTPVVMDAPLAVPVPAVAEVSLTGLGLSLTDVVGLLQGFGIGGALPDFLTSLPSLLPTDIVTAVITEFVNQASPLVLAAAGEVFDYLGAAIAGLISGPDSIPARFGDALAAIPQTVVAAFEALGSGDLATALQTITDVLAGPVSGIAAVLSEATQAFEEFLTTEFNGLITTLPAVLFSAVQTVLSGNLQSLIDTLGDALSGLLGGLIPGAGASAVPAAAAVVAVGNSPANRAQSALPAAAEVPAAVAPVAVSVAVSAPEESAAALSDETPAAATVSAPRSRGAAKAAAADQAPGASAATATAEPDTGGDAGATSQRSSAGKAGAARAAQGATR